MLSGSFRKTFILYMQEIDHSFLLSLALSMSAIYIRRRVFDMHWLLIPKCLASLDDLKRKCGYLETKPYTDFRSSVICTMPSDIRSEHQVHFHQITDWNKFHPLRLLWHRSIKSVSGSALMSSQYKLVKRIYNGYFL